MDKEIEELIELEKEFESDEVFGFVVRGKLALWKNQSLRTTKTGGQNDNATSEATSKTYQ
jgi:hypothetical protein